MKSIYNAIQFVKYVVTSRFEISANLVEIRKKLAWTIVEDESNKE